MKSLELCCPFFHFLRQLIRPPLLSTRTHLLFSCKRNVASFGQLRLLHSASSTLQSLASPAEADDHCLKASRRVVRKRRPLTASWDYQVAVGPQIVCIALGESFDLSGMVKDHRLSNMYLATCVDEGYEEGLHFASKPQYIIDKEAVREFFVFADGVVVFWGIDDAERCQILRCLESHTETAYSPQMVEDEIDTMSFCIVKDGNTRIKNDQLHLSVSQYEKEHNENVSVLERYAFSHGMAASVKVAMWESQLSKQAEPLATTAKALSEGIIPWRRKQALRKTGQFAALRHSINLNCGLLDTDFYWEREELERFYELALRHFTVPRRLKLLNNRLDYCEQLVKLVDGMLSHRHASTLEWMIIILIVIEVIFDIWHFLDRSPSKVLICNEDGSSKVEVRS